MLLFGALPVTSGVAQFDLWVMLGVTAVFVRRETQLSAISYAEP